MRNVVIASLVLAALTGCASLTPYSEIATSLPAERLVEVDGQRIFVETHGSGPTLLMLHGFAASTYSFRRIIPGLSRTHRIVAIDLNGFGFTERPRDNEDYKADRQVETIRQLLDQLGIRRCDVVAHSYGGALAILLAEKESERVRRLALISPYVEIGETPAILQSETGRNFAYGGTRVLLSSRMIARLGLMKAFHQNHLVTPEVTEEYRRRILIEGFRDTFDGYSLAMEDSGPLRLPLKSVLQPTLIIAGRHDKLVSVESCERTADAIPKATLHVLENSGHSAAEEQPDKVIRLISSFLE